MYMMQRVGDDDKDAATCRGGVVGACRMFPFCLSYSRLAVVCGFRWEE